MELSNLTKEELVALIRNKNMDSETLKLLAKDEDWRVRKAVAEHPKTYLKTLKNLAADEDWFVRLAVAKNSNTDRETLQDLAEDLISEVCLAAQFNPKYNP